MRFGLRALAMGLALAIAACTPQRTPEPDPLPMLRGIVVDAETGAPIAGVAVRAAGSSETLAVTDATGLYAIPAPEPLPAALKFAHRGYVSAVIQRSESTPLLLDARLRRSGP